MDRRPIPARKTSWANQMAAGLARAGLTPNSISVWGMIFGIWAGVLFAATRQETGAVWFWLGGGALVGLRLLANMLDGMVAEIQNSSSPVGSLFNEVPDRISDAATLIGLGYAMGSSPEMGWSAALLAVMIAYVRAQLAVSGAPQDFGGPMAKPHRMAVVIVAAVGSAVAQAVGMGAGLIPQIALAVILVGSVATLMRRLWKGGMILKQSGP